MIRRWLGYVSYWRQWGAWPSRLQRLYMQGDPTGEVKAVADAIVNQLREEGL